MLIAFFVLLSLAVAAALASIVGRRRHAPPDLRFAAQYSPRRYAPLRRILSPEEYAYVAQVAGLDSKAAKLFRRGRRRAGRRYLKALRRDFSRLHQAARFMMVHGERDQPQMARDLLTCYMQFHYRWVFAQLLLLACTTPVATRLGAPLSNCADQLLDACASLAIVPSAAFDSGHAG